MDDYSNSLLGSSGLTVNDKIVAQNQSMKNSRAITPLKILKNGQAAPATATTFQETPLGIEDLIATTSQHQMININNKAYVTL